MRTRASAYALAIDGSRILLTQLADHCSMPGCWTLPGGGIDHGEQPADALIREAFEETGLEAKELHLLHARTFSKTYDAEEFLAVQIVYRANIRGLPEVQEVGGSTAAAAWVELSEIENLPTVSLVEEVLSLLTD